MKLKRLKLDIVRLPSDVELPLFLIREGLKARKLFNGLANIGFDESLFHSDFSDAVLAYMGFEERSDDLYTWYFNLVNKYVEKAEGDQDWFAKQDALTMGAFEIYMELMIESRNRKHVK